jgi:hypothetical protein
MSKTIELEDLGITREDLTERLVANLAERLLSEHGIPVRTTVRLEDDEGDDVDDVVTSPFAQALHDRVESAVAEAVDRVAAEHVIANLDQYLISLDMTPTNRWGESNGPRLTLREWIDQRIDGWLRERVDYHGRSRAEGSGGGADTPRIVYLVHQHLHTMVGVRIEKALKEVNTAMGEGLAEVVRDEVGKIAERLSVEVSTNKRRA